MRTMPESIQSRLIIFVTHRIDIRMPDLKLLRVPDVLLDKRSVTTPQLCRRSMRACRHRSKAAERIWP
ncbi:hypothetical protein [Paraburkholderia heleia]|uniref:hypothetical protein n=1 Tax=Paraburkholderia heleia TaxID=634127 RepID=UPI0031DF75A5